MEINSGNILVRFDFGDGVAKVIPEDSFADGEETVAKAVVAADVREAMLQGRSPLYLVRKRDARLAVSAAKRMGGDHDAMVTSILGAVDIAGGEFAEAVRNSVMGVTGLIVSRSPYDCDEESEIIEEMKEINNGTHQDNV